MKTNRTNQGGMTLAEVLVAVAIFAIIFIAALMIYDQSNRVFKTGMESADVQQNTRIAFDKMLADIRMGGFDFDRDGIPTAAGEMQQVDEQVEYAGQRAITIRANLDYTEAGTNSGREADLEAPNSQFPIVTTHNDEIVTYALVSNSGSNPDTITFYADVTDGTDAARQSFAATGGQEEDTITIDGVDLCTSGTCDEPPYTLMRITLDGAGQPVMTPLASNIRSMEFSYFSDASATTALAIADAGGGQWDPDDPGASEAPRTVRTRIRAVAVTVTGMTEAPDMGYVDPNETLASARAHRKYTLETLVIPRNMGKRGLREQQTAAPGPPDLDTVCFGLCKGVRLNWTAPPSNPAYGSVESYVILWDTNIGATDPPLFALPVGLTLNYTLTNLDPTVQYRFSVAATNSWGTTYSNDFVEGYPINTTTQSPPANLVATGNPSPLEDKIELTWDLPSTNVSGQDQASCVDPAGAAVATTVGPDPSETRGVEIWRSLGDQNFDPLASPLPSTTVKVAETSGPDGSYTDTSAAGCQTYYYRIRIAEHCCQDPATQNQAPGEPWSDFFPAVGDPAIEGYTTTTTKPSAPSGLTVLNTSACAGGACTVNLQWPEVVTNVDGATIGVAQYVVEVDQNGSPYSGSPYTATYGAGLATAGGIATYSVLNLPQQDASNVPYEYTFRVLAEACALQSDPSPEDKFPKCSFGSGGQVVIVMDAIGGDGGSSTPFEVESGGTITFSVDNGAQIQSVSASAVIAGTGVPFQNLGTNSAGPAASLDLGWPGGADDTVYRVDYMVTDTGGCQNSGSFYVKDILVACAFITPAPFVTDFANDQVYLVLKNTFDGTVQIKGIDFSWTKAASGVPANRSIEVTAVRFPVPPASLNPGTTSGALNQPGGNVSSNAPAGTATLAALDQTGNYQIRIDFDVQSNVHPTGNPITGATIRWRLTTDPPALPDRTCTVYP